MKYAKTGTLSLSIACGFLLNASIVYTATIGPRIEEPDGSRLRNAMIHKNIKTVQEVLTRGQIDLHGNLSLDRTPLHWAVIKGHADIAQLLLEAGTSANVRNSHKSTPLHRAAAAGNAEVVQLLIKHKADVETKDDEGQTPLHRAAAAGNTEVVQLLIKHKADVEAKDDKGQTPLSEALSFLKKADTDTIRALIAAGADVSLLLQSVVQMLTTCDDTLKEVYRNKIRMLVQGGMKLEQDLLFRLENANENSLAQDIISIRMNLLDARKRALRERQAQFDAEIRERQAQLNTEKYALYAKTLQGLYSMTAEELYIYQKHLELLSRGGDAILWHMLPEEQRSRLSKLAKIRADFIADASTTAQRRFREQEMQKLGREHFSIMKTLVQRVIEERKIRLPE